MHKISKSRIYKIQIKTWHFQRKLHCVNLGVKNENGETMIKHLGYAGSSHIRKKGRKFKTHPQVREFCFIRYWVRRLTAASTPPGSTRYQVTRARRRSGEILKSIALPSPLQSSLYCVKVLFESHLLFLCTSISFSSFLFP